MFQVTESSETSTLHPLPNLLVDLLSICGISCFYSKFPASAVFDITWSFTSGYFEYFSTERPSKGFTKYFLIRGNWQEALTILFSAETTWPIEYFHHFLFQWKVPTLEVFSFWIWFSGKKIFESFFRTGSSCQLPGILFDFDDEGMLSRCQQLQNLGVKLCMCENPEVAVTFTEEWQWMPIVLLSLQQ